MSYAQHDSDAPAFVECFETLADGSEIGWQVKYYWDIASKLSLLGKSLGKALVRHPKMGKFIACLPFDPVDARKAGTKSALQKWETWRADRACCRKQDVRVRRAPYYRQASSQRS